MLKLLNSQPREVNLIMLETDLFTSPFLMSALISLAAGILSFLSPCVLPIVPAYLAYMAGITIQDAQSNKEVRNRKTLYVSISFVIWHSYQHLLYTGKNLLSVCLRIVSVSRFISYTFCFLQRMLVSSFSLGLEYHRPSLTVFVKTQIITLLLILKL